jgi:hypothetical protein
MSVELDHRSLYRLPWNLADNPIVWMEPTQACNLACDGCYRQNVREHKSIEEVEKDLETFARLRNFDGVSIAGGDPLCHPEVVEIVRRVTRMGRKAILNTNGLELTRELLVALKQAGLIGLTFHVDSRQGRPGWRNKTEKEMNDLRGHFAELVASVGGLACSFNSTVYEDTLDQVPDVVEWAHENIETVHTVVFITYRAAVIANYDYWSGGEKVDMEKLVYSLTEERRTDISSRDVVKVIQRRFPDFAPAAYLNGTEKPDSFKWLLALRVGNKQRVHGYAGPKYLEAVQSIYHLLQNRYLAYSPPWLLGMGRGAMTTGAWDHGMRGAALNWAKSALTSPLQAARRQHLQAIMVIQPIDVLADGRQNMCDGCPDMTLHDGKLAWSCRLEELKSFGRFVSTTPKQRRHLEVASG